jgi:hypothetical protein
MTSQIDTSISEFLSRWTLAELNGNASAMKDLLADDFVGVGPLGFLLSKQAWLERFGTHGLHYDGFQLEDRRGPRLRRRRGSDGAAGRPRYACRQPDPARDARLADAGQAVGKLAAGQRAHELHGRDAGLAAAAGAPALRQARDFGGEV